MPIKDAGVKAEEFDYYHPCGDAVVWAEPIPECKKHKYDYEGLGVSRCAHCLKTKKRGEDEEK